MLPFILRVGFRAYHPKGLIGQLWRGAAHTSGMLLWFMALPHLPLAETTAIGFTGPIFVMIGAVLFFHEPMLWRRWISALIGFAGVLIVVWPKLSGSSESVRRLHEGLQSFLSMRRMDARRRKASALWLRFSQSLASLRQRLSQPMERSTIQRLGSTTKPLA
jgi:drug/metabolite transporter (DMT)-like permease